MCHLMLVLVVLFGWMYHRPLVLLMPAVFCVWSITNNCCPVTVVENRLYGYVLIPPKSGYVPWHCRFFLFSYFLYVLTTLM